MTISISMLNSRRKKEEKPDKMKKKIVLTLILFSVLIVANVLIGFIGNPGSSSSKLDQLSNEFDGGQIGLVLVYGNPGPSQFETSEGSGSMKDIEVLDSLEHLEIDFENENDPNNPNEPLINSPFNIVDIMKMIKIPEDIVEHIPSQSLPPMLQSINEELVNLSFWDAIHTAGQSDSVIWYYRYDKSFQDSLINIFYESLTQEMRRTFVNEDYSRSLIYFHIPMRGEDQSIVLRNELNNIIDPHEAFIPVSRLVFIDSINPTSQNIVLVIKIIIPFGVLAVGIVVFILLSNEIRNLEKKDKEGAKPVEAETVSKDITDEKNVLYEEYPYKGPPPGYSP
jgi:flagellar basal body-associated protein FliL